MYALHRSIFTRICIKHKVLEKRGAKDICPVYCCKNYTFFNKLNYFYNYWGPKGGFTWATEAMSINLLTSLSAKCGWEFFTCVLRALDWENDFPQYSQLCLTPPCIVRMCFIMPSRWANAFWQNSQLNFLIPSCTANIWCSSFCFW